MARDLIRVAVVELAGASPSPQLSVGAFKFAGGGDVATPEYALTLLELFAYLGDLLGFYQDEVANEAALPEPYWDEEQHLLRIALDPNSYPSLCLVASNEQAYFLAVRTDGDHAALELGEAAAGRLPISGSENVTVSYRQGGGGAGHLELRAPDLRQALVVLVASPNGPREACLHWWRTDAGESQAT